MSLDPLKGRTLTERSVILAATLAFVTLVVMIPNLANGWVAWDDLGYVLDNSMVHGLNLENIRTIFNSPSVMGNYHPITLLSLALDYQIGQQDPFIYHLHNVLLHIINGILIFYFSFLLSRRLDHAFFVALIWSIHPMHHEVVTWISARKDLVGTFYYIAALIAYVHFIRKKQRNWYWIGLLLFVCSLLSKATAVTLPFIFILIDYWEGIQPTIRSLKEKIPFFAISALFGFLAIASQENAISWSSDIGFTRLSSIFNAIYALVIYFIKALLPVHLSPFHPYPNWYFEAQPWYIYASIIPAILIIRWIIKAFKKDKALFFGGTFFLLTILPLLQLLPVGIAITSERYTYLPYFGLFFFLSYRIIDLLHGRSFFHNISISSRILILLTYLSFLSLTTVILAGHWKNTDTLWTRVIEQYPENFFAYFQRGNFHFDQRNYPQAVYDYDQARRYNPYFIDLLRYRCDAKQKIRDVPGAIADLDTLLSHQPNNTIGLAARGRLQSNLGNHLEAMEDLNKKVAIDSLDPAGYWARAVVLERLGHLKEALLDYSTGINLSPNNPGAFSNRGLVLLRLGYPERALENFDRALDLQPKFAQALVRRARAKRALRNHMEAFEDAQAAQSMGYSVDSLWMDSLRLEAR